MLLYVRDPSHIKPMSQEDREERRKEFTAAHRATARLEGLRTRLIVTTNFDRL